MRSSARATQSVGPAVAGVGTTRYGKLPEYNAYDLGLWALREALEDCGLQFSDIDGLIVNRIPDYRHFAESCGINPRYTLATPGHGRFAGVCIQTAMAVLAAGFADTIALVYSNTGRSSGVTYGGQSASSGTAAGAAGSTEQHWAPYGMTSPGAWHAMLMQAHMHRYGSTTDQLAAVAMAFREHAALNPDAVMRTPFSLDEYRRSKPICSPLRLLDYCLINDGAVAIIITTEERARDLRQRPVSIRGVAQSTRFADSAFPPDDFWQGAMASAAHDVYAMAGVERDDMDGLMIYDNFTPTVLMTLEGFGFCAPGEGGPLAQSGALRLGGRYPTNTNGGHLSESYMQGWSLNVEAVRQVRGTCGARQIPGANHIQYMAAAPIVTSIIYGAA